MPINKLRSAISVFCVLLFAAAGFSQSTSSWVRISDGTIGNPKITSPTPGATYVTVMFRGASVYQNSNWWTNFVEKHRQAVLSISLDGKVAGVQVHDTKVSAPIELRRNKSNVAFGYSDVPIVQNLPTTFDFISLNVSVNKTATDGLEDLLTALGTISKETPGIQVSQQTLGVVSASKVLADYLFNKRLLVQEISSPSAISASLGRPGIYAILAGDSSQDYDQYLKIVPGNVGLHWENGRLTWNGSDIQGVSYFVVEIGYTDRVFGNPQDALSYGSLRPWSTLYELARREISGINAREDLDNIKNKMRSQLMDARSFLDADLDFIQSERDSIDQALRQKVQTELIAREVLMGIISPPPTRADSGPVSVPTQPPTTNPNNPVNPNNPANPTILMTAPSDTSSGETIRRLQVETEVQDTIQKVHELTLPKGMAPPHH